MGKIISYEKVNKLMAELRKEPDIKNFREEKGQAFCKKYGIDGKQLNFMMAVVAVERMRQGNDEVKQNIINKRNDKLSR
jgi:hypothetical protein